jgi:hypothetical protein
MITKKIKLQELRNLIKKIIKEEYSNIYTDKYFKTTIDKPIIPDAIKVISSDKNSIKFTDKNKFNSFLKKQKYFSASYSHCYYSMDDYTASCDGDKRFRDGCTGVSEADRGCVMLFETGELVAIWDEKNKIGYIIPSKR